ncbi:HIT-like domain-containing protein [Radiomyces spectabilis]|uniref:HIT-like domain-containing protein n=1 Tax=Radiomyces spectabilis TaxID=64574 RepID=UPI00221FF5C4|nr:HIT-like domain-containing protein [Radiomyces spectabilis]KAI8374550.1 HIT-like domain-containing protein [Radiomyces spectabilis]
MSSIDTILQEFRFERVLSHDTRTKLLFVLGQINGENCILSFEKSQYTDEDIPQLACQTHGLTDITQNDIYGWASARITTVNPDTRVKIIYPATDLHIRKYEQQARFLIQETPELFKMITWPYIQSLDPSRIQWVYNILEGKSEAERVIYRDTDPKTGFVILPDMKWDGSKESLYWVVIAARDDIYSLRSLTPDHLDLLKNIRQRACQLAEEKFGLKQKQLRLFVHYQPSYYHFHVHVTAVSFADAPGVVAGQAHLLDTVIDNLQLMADYYQRATLPFVVGERHPLCIAYQAQEDGIERQE